MKARTKSYFSRGQQAAEFAGALVILILCIVIPLANMSMIPIRYGLAQNIIKKAVRQYSLSEALSDSFKRTAPAADLEQALKSIYGVEPQTINLELIANSNKLNLQETFNKPRIIPAAWLPDGRNCPCNYNLSLKVKAKISPLITLSIFGQHIPGLSGPIEMEFNETGNWENLGRNANSGEFFLNE